MRLPLMLLPLMLLPLTQLPLMLLYLVFNSKTKKFSFLFLFQGKLNLQYRASDEKDKMYRALQILNPSPELSGEYRCFVATFEHEASLSKKMVVFGKLKFFSLPRKKHRFSLMNEFVHLSSFFLSF